jgi:hypothetical protein
VATLITPVGMPVLVVEGSPVTLSPCKEEKVLSREMGVPGSMPKSSTFF